MHVDVESESLLRWRFESEAEAKEDMNRTTPVRLLCSCSTWDCKLAQVSLSFITALSDWRCCCCCR